MVPVLGRQMFVMEQGAGPETIILVHGFPTSSYDYHRVVGQLPMKLKHLTISYRPTQPELQGCHV